MTGLERGGVRGVRCDVVERVWAGMEGGFWIRVDITTFMKNKPCARIWSCVCANVCACMWEVRVSGDL